MIIQDSTSVGVADTNLSQ